jgi:hypothetical protein
MASLPNFARDCPPALMCTTLEASGMNDGAVGSAQIITCLAAFHVGNRQKNAHTSENDITRSERLNRDYY